MYGPTLQVCKEILQSVGVGEGCGQDLEKEDQGAKSQEERHEAEQPQGLDHLLHPGIRCDQHQVGHIARAALLPRVVSPGSRKVEATVVSSPGRDGRYLGGVQLVLGEIHRGLGHIGA